MEQRKTFYPGQTDEQATPQEEAARQVSRQAAAEGMVLLKNDGALPLRAGARVALLGLGARHPIKGGTGSGDVNSRDVISVDQGLREAGFEVVNTDYLDEYDRIYAENRQKWTDAIVAEAGPERNWGKLYDAHVRMTCPLPQIALPEKGWAEAEAVIYVLSRTSGEGADRRDAPGDYYLAAAENDELAALCAWGKPVVVLLNVGGVIDLSFLDTLPIAGLVLMGQAGCDSGRAAADILSGAVNPSGRLTDSWAYRYEDYPSSRDFSFRNGNLKEEYYTDGLYVGYRYFDAFGVRPRYPFGYGLSYTRFEQQAEALILSEREVSLTVRVRNAGGAAGRQVVQLYAACPAAEQPKEFKRLIAFGKTGLLAPGAEEVLTLRFDIAALASYRPGYAAWFLERGDYVLLLAENAAECTAAGKLTLGETANICQVSNICDQVDALKEIEPPAENRAAWDAYLAEISRGVPSVALDQSISLPEPRMAAAAPSDQARQILARLTEDEKIRLCVGAPSAMSGEAIGEAGNAVPGAAGETVSVPEKGLPAMVLADGPAGLRMQKCYEIDPATGLIHRLDRFSSLLNRFFGVMEYHAGYERRYQFATAIPVGTLLAQSFDPAMLERVGGLIADEMRRFGVTVWLAPGMNIHRNPLCGRNFEYFSEDPLVSGLMAAAITRGVQQKPGACVTIKHFACNNQEDNRMGVSAVISERTLREIYLKGFEIAVKTSQPLSIMTSYNRVNGVHTANSYDLCTKVARQEWGFGGFIMTDWTTTNSGHGSSAAKCVLAGNDLVMPGRDADRREIRQALRREIGPALPMDKLDESALRLIDAAIRLNG